MWRSRAASDNRSGMQGSSLHERLHALLDAPLYGEGSLSLEQVERTLTDGYALALALDAERSRLAKRIGQLAANDGDDAQEKARELSSLSQRLAETDTELSRLRRSLANVRRRSTEMRAATALA
jgi:ABC-type phosphate transport system auxiliary subunit